MKKAKKIEITGCWSNSFWYNKLVGCTFDVVREEDTMYVVVVGGKDDCLIRKSDCKVIEWEELSYKERQEEWVKKHNLKAGDKLRVTQVANDRQDGWCNSWEPWLASVGEVVEYIGIARSSGLYCRYDGYMSGYPFFALEPIKHWYRPFKNAEEFEPYRDCWFRVKGSGGYERASFYDEEGIKDAKGVFVSYAQLLSFGEFEDGTPAGIKV
jgi:hypothetical protein